MGPGAPGPGRARHDRAADDAHPRIKERLRYVARDDEGTQPPHETLAKGGGTCRDYALLMMEAVRSLGFAARFVTGYLYDPALDGGPTGTQGAGATHAWVQVYLPGAGWVEFDPTNGIVGGRNLIRVGVARDPKQAIPLAGSFIGSLRTIWGMTVEVARGAHRRRAAPPDLNGRRNARSTMAGGTGLDRRRLEPGGLTGRWQSVQKAWNTVSIRRHSVVPQALWQARQRFGPRRARRNCGGRSRSRSPVELVVEARRQQRARRRPAQPDLRDHDRRRCQQHPAAATVSQRRRMVSRAAARP